MLFRAYCTEGAAEDWSLQKKKKKKKFSIADFFRKCDQNRRKLRVWSHLHKKSFMENFIFRAVDWSKAKQMSSHDLDPFAIKLIILYSKITSI